MPTSFGLAAMGSNATNFLVNENCEGTGTASGWTNGTGTPNWDYTATPLEGSQSLYLPIAVAAHRTFIDFGDRDEVFIYFLMRYTNGSAPGGSRTLAAIAPNGSTTAITTFTYVATLKIQFATAAPTAVTVADTTYHVWLHYRIGTGANSVASCGFSTTGIRPTAAPNNAEVTNGAAVLQAGRLLLGTTTTTTNEDFIFDKIRVAGTVIGDNGGS